MKNKEDEKEPDYMVAHNYSSKHEQQILTSEICGCFYCLDIFKPSEVVEWIEEASGAKTAMCPKCGI